MQFVNKETGVLLEPKNELVKEQLEKDPRFVAVEQSVKAEAEKKKLVNIFRDEKEKPLSKMNRGELLEQAARLHLTIQDTATNKEIEKAIQGVKK